MAFLSASKGSSGKNGGASGGGGGSHRSSSRGSGGYFSSRSSSRRNGSSSGGGSGGGSSSSSGSSNGGNAGGVSASGVDCGGGSVCRPASDYGLLEMDENDNSFPWGLLHHNELAHMLNSGLGKTMVIDSRSFLEYNTSNIQQSVNVCCSKLVKRRLQQDKVHVFDLLSQTCHVGADASWDVIVYDQCTEDPSLLTTDNFVHVLLRKLSTAFNSVAFLKGGFLAFQASHSNLVENKTSSYRCSTLTSLSQPCMPVSNVGPTRILSFLYLGSQQDSMAQEMAQVNGISYMLNVSKTCPKPPFIMDSHFHRIPVNDNYCEKLLPFFQEAFQFLDKVREANGCALVHCLGGVSRSATLTIAYIMKHMKMSSDEAYRYVKDKRPTISPNFNFLGQLLEYEKIVRREEVEEVARRQALRALRGAGGGDDDGLAGGTDRASPMSAMDLHTSSPSSPGPRSAGRSFVLESLSPCVLPSPLATQVRTTPSQECPFPGPGSLAMEESVTTPQSPLARGDSHRQQQSASPYWHHASSSSSTSSSTSSSRVAAATVTAKTRQQRSSHAHAQADYSTGGLSTFNAAPDWQAGEEACPFPGPLCELRPYPGPSYQNPAYTQPPSLGFHDDDQAPSVATTRPGGAKSPLLCDKIVSVETLGQQPLEAPTSTAAAQSPVCPLTGFPNPASLGQDGPSSTCTMTGFPGPGTLARSQQPTQHIDNGHAHSKCHIPPQNDDSEISSGTPTPTTYHSHDLMDNFNVGPSLGPVAGQACNPSSAAISQQQQQQHQPDPSQQKARQGFSLSSMFSSFRWRSRPPTLSLGSPVGPAKDRRKRGEGPVIGTQLTPVSEASENCDPPFVESGATKQYDSERRDLNLRNSEQPTIDNHPANDGCSYYPSAACSAPLPQAVDAASSMSGANFKSAKGVPAKTRSLKLNPRNFFLSLSSPTSDFYISSALSSASPSSPIAAAAAPLAGPSSSRIPLQSPTTLSPSSSSKSQSLPSPGDSNKRKSGFLSHFNSPDKLARKEDPSTSSVSSSPLSPPKTLNLAQSGQAGGAGGGKSRQRLGIKKPSFLTLSSPTAAMARLNFSSPSNPTKDFSPLPAAEQNREMDASVFGSSSPSSAARDKGLRVSSVSERMTCQQTKDGFHAQDFISKSQSNHPHPSEKGHHSNNLASLTESSLSAFSSSMSSSYSSSHASSSSKSTSHSSALEASTSSSSNNEGAFPSSLSLSLSSSSSVNYQGLSKFPTTSLDKLSFTPCSVRDIVQDLKNSSDGDVVPKPTEDQQQCSSLLTDGQLPSSALDSPMSISSGSSAPSLASSTLSPVDTAMTNPFPSGASSDVREIADEEVADSTGSSSSPLAAFQQFGQQSSQDNPDEDSYTDSGVHSGQHQPPFPSQDNSSAACTPDSMFSPSSSLPQASISPTIPPTLTSPCYSYASSSLEPLSPMSLDGSNSSSPICSPSEGGGVCLVSSFSSSPSLTSPVSSTQSLMSSTSSSLTAVSSSSMTIHSSSSISSSSSTTSSTTKVVLRKDRGKRMALARPNSIAFSSYPTCDLVSTTTVNNNNNNKNRGIINLGSSRDDASEEFMAVSGFTGTRPLLSPDAQAARLGRTSWGGYSEKEVYRQITEAMESAMLRTQAYIPQQQQQQSATFGPLPSPNSRKARSLDDIVDSNDMDQQEFQSDIVLSGLKESGGGGGGGGSHAHSGSNRGSSNRFHVGFSPDKNLPASMLFEPYHHCAMHGGAEPYQSNSSLSSNGSHGSLHSSLEIIQVS